MNKILALIFTALVLLSGQAWANQEAEMALQEEIDAKREQAEAAGFQPDGEDIQDITIDILYKKVVDGKVKVNELEATFGAHYVTPTVERKVKLKLVTEGAVINAAGNGGGTELGDGKP